MSDIYAEFDDIDRKGSFVGSPKAREEIRRLAAQHHLGFVFNPGGGEFNGRKFRCQISTYDDVEDLNTLRKALAARSWTCSGCEKSFGPETEKTWSGGEVVARSFYCPGCVSRWQG